MRFLTKHEVTALIGGMVSIAAILGFLGYVFSPEKPLRLMTQVYADYQVENPDGTITGRAVEVVKCALDSLEVAYTIEITPESGWLHSQLMVENGEADGFFEALREDRRDKFAILTSNLTLNRTYFVKLRDNKMDRHDPKVTWVTKTGSGINMQLEKMGGTITSYSTSNAESIQQLLAGKGDFVYMDFALFRWSAKQADIHDKLLDQLPVNPATTVVTDLFVMEPGAEQGLGLYLSRKWAHAHPAMIERINSAITSCRQNKEFSYDFPPFRAPRMRRKSDDMEEEIWASLPLASPVGL